MKTFVLTAIRLFGKNWKKVTQHVGTRISAQVRSHAQKVLKDYSPNSHAQEGHDPSKSEMTEQINNETMTLPKENTIRTDDVNHAAPPMDMGVQQTSNDGINDCLTTNLN